jgi:transposase-like protein
VTNCLVTTTNRIRLFPPIEKGTKPRKRTARPAPYTAADFNAEFRNDDLCLEYIREQRWPAAVTHCVKCGNRSKHHRVTGRTAYACGNCGNQIYPLAGTIFAKSRMPLKKWFYAIYLIGSTDCSITAKQLQRETGVTYKTAWRLSRSIRQLMASEDRYRESLLSQREASSKGDDHGVALGDNTMPLVGETNPCESTTVRAVSSGGSVSDAIT